MTKRATREPLLPQTTMATALSDTLKPFFAGLPPEVTGAAMADLLATWLAGHFVAGDEKVTNELRETLLIEHIAAVRLLIPECEKIILEVLRAGSN